MVLMWGKRPRRKRSTKKVPKGRFLTRAFRMARNLRTGGFIGRELKFIDSERNTTLTQNAVAGAEMDPTSSLSISAVPQGTGESERIGRVTWVKQVLVQGHINVPNSTSYTETGGYLHIWLVIDKQTNGAQLNSEDVLAAPAQAALSVDAFQNLQYSDRFKVVKKKKVVVPPLPITHTGSANVVGSNDIGFQFYYKCHVKQEFTGTGGTVSDMSTNSFHVIAIGAGTLPECTLRMRYRVRYLG